MYRYCSKCGCKCLENTKFCESCGAELIQYNASATPKANNNYNDFEQQVADTYECPKPQQVVEQQYYSQAQNYSPTQKSSKLKPILAIVAVVAIVGMLIAVYFLVPFNGNNEEQSANIMTTGPKVSLQSLANGNTMVIPEVGFTCVYGYYLDKTKIGEISFYSEGVETYEGEECIKIIGDGYYDIEAYSEQLTITYAYDAYVANDDYNLKYIHFIMSYYGTDMDMTMTYDKETGEITTSYSYSGYDSTTVMKMSEDYWELSEINNILYVGYETEFSYTIDSYGTEVETTIKLSVTDKKDISVPAGKFKDCYQIELSQESIAVSTIWINNDGIVPKMQVASSGLGSTDSLILQLESYQES